METGTKISASAHVALLGAMLIGNPFRSEPLPISAQDVSVISSAQFEAMLAAQQQPATEAALPQIAPEPEPEALPAPSLEAEPVVPTVPEPEPEPAPTPAPPEPEAQTPVEEAPPTIEPPSEDVVIDAPEPSPTPAPQQADRVAPEPVAQPEPDVASADTQQDAVEDTADAATPLPEQDATAPEETTTELLTEADEAGSSAPAQSVRPPSRRPERPAQTAQAPEEPPAPEPVEDPVSDDVADDIAAAVAEAQAPAAPSGPPLTGGEVDGLRVAVSNCWNVGTLSTEAQDTSVTVYVAMNQDGTPKRETIAMQSFSGGSDSAARKVFETARRAIIRCGARGFPLPVEKYGQWQEIEMTFKPEGVFWR